MLEGVDMSGEWEEIMIRVRREQLGLGQSSGQLAEQQKVLHILNTLLGPGIPLPLVDQLVFLLTCLKNQIWFSLCRK